MRMCVCERENRYKTQPMGWVGEPTHKTLKINYTRNCAVHREDEWAADFKRRHKELTKGEVELGNYEESSGLKGRVRRRTSPD